MELGKSIERQNGDVEVRLAKHLIATNVKGSNLVFSPTSINVLLSLIAAGSNCATKEEILSFLMLPSTDHLIGVLAQIIENGTKTTENQLSVANGVWIDKYLSLKPSFKEILEKPYKATCSQVDFASKPAEVIDEVNTWAEDQTNGLIKQILSQDSIESIRMSSLILANAVYFNGAWSIKFDATLTEDKSFHLLDGTSVKIPFMTNDEDQYLEDYDGFQVLRLPYVEDQRQFSMYIYLPNDKDGLAALVEKIGSEPGFFNNHIPIDSIQVDAFRIPKFEFSFEFEASNVLKDMGLTSPFTCGGNLTEMVDLPSNYENDLYVSRILHKACIVVDEEGTEAAAVTVAEVEGCCLSLTRDPDFVADHPFLFTVREDKSGVILFIGQVLDPSKH